MDRLSVLDAEFLHMEDASSQFHIASLCTLDGPVPSREEVLRLVSAKLPLMPRYRKRVRFLPFELGRPVWVDDPNFDLAYHVRWTALPAPGDDAALTALMGRLMSQLLDRNRPLWELWIIEGLQGGRWGLISKLHHSMVDGISGVELQTILLDNVPNRPLPPIVTWTPEPPPKRLALVLDAWKGLAQDTRAVVARAVKNARHPRAGARALKDTAAGLASLTGRLLGFKTGPIQGTIGSHRAYAHASVSLADVQAIRKVLGGSVNDVVLAAISGGYRALIAQRQGDPDHTRVRTLVPVSVRGPGADLLHNRVSAILCDLPLEIADPVARLREVSARMDLLKKSHMAEAGALFIDLGDLAPPMVVGPITRFIARAMHRVPQRALGTVTTNVPGPREPLYFLGRKMIEWYPYVPISQGLRVGTAILSYAGRLSFGITSDYDTVPDTSVLARAIESEIAALKRSAGNGVRMPISTSVPAS